MGPTAGDDRQLDELETTSKDNLVDAINEAAQSGGGSGGTPVTEQTVSDWGFTKNTGTYSKPSDGIPKTDLADDVQASLSKANSALQAADINGYATEDYVNNAISAAITDIDTLIGSGVL